MRSSGRMPRRDEEPRRDQHDDRDAAADRDLEQEQRAERAVHAVDAVERHRDDQLCRLPVGPLSGVTETRYDSHVPTPETVKLPEFAVDVRREHRVRRRRRGRSRQYRLPPSRMRRQQSTISPYVPAGSESCWPRPPSRRRWLRCGCWSASWAPGLTASSCWSTPCRSDSAAPRTSRHRPRRDR